MGLFDSVAGALGGAQGQGGAGGLGPLGNVLGSVLGGASGGQGGQQAALVGAVLALLSQGGGLGALVEKFQRGGLGEVVGSWVGTGQNLPVSSQQLEQVIGGDLLGQIAGHLGVSPQQASAQMSQWLPQAVDQLTPAGRLPTGGEPGAGHDLGLGDLGTLLGRFTSR